MSMLERFPTVEEMMVALSSWMARTNLRGGDAMGCGKKGNGGKKK